MKKRKLSQKEYIKIAKQLEVANQLREDSIAQLNKELFKWDKEKNKLLVSKKCLNYLLNISQCQLLERPLDFELVDEIKIL